MLHMCNGEKMKVTAYTAMFSIKWNNAKAMPTNNINYSFHIKAIEFV